MGTLLQARGLKPGELPEKWNIERADDIVSVAKKYYEAGSNVVYTNTFGANKSPEYSLTKIFPFLISSLKSIL